MGSENAIRRTFSKLLENETNRFKTMNASVTFSLNPVAPFRLDLTAWALRRRPSNVIDRWDGETYRRVLVMNGNATEVAVRQSGSPDSPRLRVSLTSRRNESEVKAFAKTSLERLLGLRINLAEFYRLAKADRKLGALAQRFRGLKPTRFLTIFEALVNAIKPIWNDEKRKISWSVLASIAAGLGITLLAELDFLAMCGLELKIPVVGYKTSGKVIPDNLLGKLRH